MSEQSNRFRSQDQINEALIGVPGFFDDIRKRVEARDRARVAQPTPEPTQSLGRKILGLNRVLGRLGHSHQAKSSNPGNNSNDTQ